MKSYMDPGFPAISAADVSVAEGTAYNVSYDFATNSKPKKSAAKQATKIGTAIFDKLGIISNDENAPALNININNVADLGEARKKGFGIGLTLGASGTTVVDGYEITMSYDDSNGPFSKSYEHAIHSTIGKEAAPFADVPALGLKDAFSGVLESAILTFLKDMQMDGKVAMNDKIRLNIEIASQEIAIRYQ